MTADITGADRNRGIVEFTDDFLNATSCGRDALCSQFTGQHGAQFTPLQADHTSAVLS